MSTEQICIAQLRTWVVLNTSDIESLLDAVPARDKLNVSEFYRFDPVDPSRTKGKQGVTPSSEEQDKKPKLGKEWNEKTDGKWEERPINSQEAKTILAGLVQKYYARDLFVEHEELLGKEHFYSDRDSHYRRITGEIAALRNDDPHLFETVVYDKFLDVLLLDCDAVIKHIASKRLCLKPGIPDDVAYRIRALWATNEVRTDTAQPPSVPLVVKNRVASVADKTLCGRKTREENSTALPWIASRRAMQRSEKEIANALKDAGAGNAVIGYLLAPDGEDLSAVDNLAAGKRGRRARGLS